MLDPALTLFLCLFQEEDKKGSVYPDPPPGLPPETRIEDATATDSASMKHYIETLPGTEVGFAMVPIPGGKLLMGSPETEEDRSDDESPQHEVIIDPFWMGSHEVTWDEYQVFMFKLDQEARRAGRGEKSPQDPWADAVSRPTPPYVPMDFGMGVNGYPAISMTQFAAMHYTRWLSMKTGRFYRLPTEAEWEHACRSGTTTAWSFGDDPAQLGEYAWYFDNSDGKYQKVGQKKPNPWGLYDIHGNVCEWTLDQHRSDFYAVLSAAGSPAENPVAWPTTVEPRVVRGGSYDDDPETLRSAARRGSKKSWKVQDPQFPKSIWYYTDAKFVGLRVVRPLRAPSEEDRRRCHDPDVEEIRQILEKQRRGER